MQKISDKDPKHDVLAVRKHGTSCQRNTGMYFATARNYMKYPVFCFYRKKRCVVAGLIGLIFFLFVFMTAGCVTNDPVPENYYEDISKIKGGNAPSVPSVTFDKNSWTITYSSSIDPDTSSEVPLYYFYVYTERPLVYYQFYDIALVRESAMTKSFTINPITEKGTYYIIVTGFDYGRESAISSQNTLEIHIP